MALTREVIYQVDDSQLRASNAELARSETTLQALLREREAIANRRSSGEAVTIDETRALIAEYQRVNNAIREQRESLSETRAESDAYAQSIERTSNLLREFAGITYDGQVWRDAQDGLMSPGEVAAVVDQYRELSRIMEKVGGIKFDGTAFRDQRGQAMSADQVQNTRDMVQSLAETDRGTQGLQNMSRGFNVLRSQILPTTQTANGFTNLLETLVDRQMEAAVSSRQQAVAARAAGSSMDVARTSALALRAALGGIVLQVLITFLTAGVGALHRMRDAHREAGQAAREQRGDLLDLIEATRRLTAERAFQGRQDLQARRGEEASRFNLAGRGLGEVGRATSLPGAVGSGLLLIQNVNRSLVDRLETQRLITAEQAQQLRLGQVSASNLSSIQATLRSVRQQSQNTVSELERETAEMDRRNALNPFYERAPLQQQQTAIIGSGVRDSPQLRAINARIQQLDQQITASGQVGTVDGTLGRTEARAAEREALRAEREALMAENQALESREAAALENFQMGAITVTATRVRSDEDARAERNLSIERLRQDLAVNEQTISLLEDEDSARQDVVDNELLRRAALAEERFRVEREIQRIERAGADDDLARANARADLELEQARVRIPLETPGRGPDEVATRAAALIVAEQTNLDQRAENLRAFNQRVLELEGERAASQLALFTSYAEEREERESRYLTRLDDDYERQAASDERRAMDAQIAQGMLRAGLLDTAADFAAASAAVGAAWEVAETDEERERLAKLKAELDKIIAKMGEAADKAGESWFEGLESDMAAVVAMAREVAGILDGLGQEGLGSLVNDIANVGEAVGRTATAAATGDVVGIVTGAVSIGRSVFDLVKGINDRREAEERSRRALELATAATRANTDALLEQGQIGARYTEEQLSIVAPGLADAREALSGARRRLGGTVGFSEAQDEINFFLQALQNAGLEVGDLQQQFAAALDISDPARRRAALAALLDETERRFGGLNSALGTYGDSLSGAIAEFDDAVRFVGLEGQEAMRAFFDLLRERDLDFGDLAELIRDGGSMTPEEIAAFVARAFESQREGTFEFGDLSPEEVGRILSQALSFTPAGEQGGNTRSVSQITERQADLLLGYNQEQLRVQRSILSTLSSFSFRPAVPTDTSDRPSTTTNLNVGVTLTERMSDEQIGQVAGREIAKKLSEARIAGRNGRTNH